MPSFGELVTDGLKLAGQDTDSDFEDVLKASLNRVYRYMLQAASADEQRREFTLTTTSGTAAYGMPLLVKRVLNIEDTTNSTQIFDISAREFDLSYPGSTTTGNPWKVFPIGVRGVQTHNTSASTLTLVSSSSADDGTVYVRVTGLVSNVLTTELVTLDGTTSVQTTNTYDASGVERLVRSTDTGVEVTGKITVTAGAVTMAAIPIWWASPSYLWYEFYPIPSSALTYNVRCLMRRPDLVKDQDWPEIDQDFQGTILRGALAEVLPSVGKTSQAQMYAQRFEMDMKKYQGIHGAQPNRIRTMSDISDGISTRAIRRPQIKGVDYV